MSAPVMQTTLRAPFDARGIGIHTGRESTVSVGPAPANTGLVFEVAGARIPALAANVVDTSRCTSLGAGDARVDTVEHILSALYGCHIDNAIIRVSGSEIPILDGSAAPWVAQVVGAGVESLAVPASIRRLGAPVCSQSRDGWAAATPADRLTITVITDYGHPLLGPESLTTQDEPAWYAREVAPARTFGFAREIEQLVARGLALGGSLENALVVYDDRFSDDLRVPNECMRHKALDFMGDLALIGGRMCATITAVRPGHAANVAFVNELAGAFSPVGA